MCVTSTPMFVCEHLVADCCALQVYRFTVVCITPSTCIIFTVVCDGFYNLQCISTGIILTECVMGACTRRWAYRPQQAPPPAPPPRHSLRHLHHHPARHPLPALLRKHRQCQEKRLRPQQAPPPAPPPRHPLRPLHHYPACHPLPSHSRWAHAAVSLPSPVVHAMFEAAVWDPDTPLGLQQRFIFLLCCFILRVFPVHTLTRRVGVLA